MFSVGEKLVAIGSDEYPYDAKVVEIDEIDGVQNYIIHFDGWNDRHDEAVAFGDEEGKLFKGTLEDFVSENRSKMSAECLKIVEKKINAAQKKKENEEMKKKNRESILHFPSSSVVEERWHWKLEIPSGLQKILVEDQKKMKEGRFAKVPAQFSVEHIFEEYLESINIDRHGPKTGEQQLTQHHNEMMLDYFNLYLSSKILCKAERIEYKALRKEIRTVKRFRPSEHYGFIHFVRFFAVIPGLLELTERDEKHFKNITPVVQKFIDWLEENQAKFYDKTKSYLKC